MKKILIVDDEKQIRDMLRSWFERNNYKVFEAENGNNAVEVYIDNSIDLIIMDLIMPDGEGLDAIQKLKASKPDVKIIAFSGGGLVGPEEYLSIAEKIGVSRTFKKPLEQVKLLREVEEVLTE